MDLITEDINLVMGLDTILIQGMEGIRPDMVGRRVGTTQATTTIIPVLFSGIASIWIMCPATTILIGQVIITGNP